MNWLALGKAVGVFALVVMVYVAVLVFIYLSPMIATGSIIAVISICFIGMLYAAFR